MFLDDLNEIQKIDRHQMLSYCKDAYQHYKRAAEIATTMSVRYPPPQTIIVGGMGGSAIGGELLRDWARDKVPIPIAVCRDYSLPEYANRLTLVIVVSYSGETEEALSLFLDALTRNCMIVCISSGGTLLKFAAKLGIPSLHVPPRLPPRVALPYLFIPCLILLKKIGCIAQITSEISEAVDVLTEISATNSPETPVKVNVAKTLASHIHGTFPIICGFGIYRAASKRLKQQFNENSKILSKWASFPELNHNEIVGWLESNDLTSFSFIFIRDKDESEVMRNRIEVTKALLRKTSQNIFEVWSEGTGRLAKMLSVVLLGDFVSVYLATIRRIDPTPITPITLLKDQLRKTGEKKTIITQLQDLVSQKG